MLYVILLCWGVNDTSPLFFCGKWRIILVFTEKVVSLHAESKTSAMTDNIRKVLRNVIGGG